MYTEDELDDIAIVLNKLTVVQLKDILGEMGLKKTGLKADLVDRILQGQFVAFMLKKKPLSEILKPYLEQMNDFQ